MNLSGLCTECDLSWVKNEETVSTGVHVPVPQAYTVRCEAKAYAVTWFVALAQNQSGHIVALRAQLGGVVLIDLDPNSKPPMAPSSVPTLSLNI